MNPNKLREDFEILKNNKLIYFDNACMTLRPRQVVESINEYYNKYPACAGRSVHKLSNQVTEKVHESRKLVQKYFNAKKDENIIFTRNTTEGINLVANAFKFQKGDVVLATDKEHNSNLIPWLVKQKRGEITRKYVPSGADNLFDIKKFQESMTKQVKLVSVVHTSNLDGTTTPVKEITKIAHDFGAKVLVDGAHSAGHHEVDVKNIDCDFLAFSAHKMMGPSGVGGLYVKESAFDSLNTFMVGGDTVFESTYDSFELEKIPEKYEAGLQDYAGIIGFGTAAKYVDKIGRKDIENHEYELNKIITDGLSNNPKIQIIGPKDPKHRSGIFSFIIQGMDVHLAAQMLDANANIAVRSGAHCVHSWFNAHKLKGTIRASLYAYNTQEEAKIFVEKVNEISKLTK